MGNISGKGVTFDSGGISIKPSAGMEEMRGDMGGGACVLASIYAAATLRLPVNVKGTLRNRAEIEYAFIGHINLAGLRTAADRITQFSRQYTTVACKTCFLS